MIAGGTDWFPSRGRATYGESLLDITGIGALRGVVREDGGWRIGAATTWSELAAAPLPPAFDG